jgi:hypothetical protein
MQPWHSTGEWGVTFKSMRLAAFSQDRTFSVQRLIRIRTDKELRRMKGGDYLFTTKWGYFNASARVSCAGFYYSAFLRTNP